MGTPTIQGFIEFYTIGMIYKDGAVNWLGVILLCLVIGYIYFRITSRTSSSSGGGGNSYQL